MWQAKPAHCFNYAGVPAVGEGKVVVSRADSVYAFDDATGKELWRFRTRVPDNAGLGRYQTLINGSSPALCRSHVFVGGDDGWFYVLDLGTGEKRWEYRVGTPIKASPAISGNMVFVSAFDGNVYAFVADE